MFQREIFLFAFYLHASCLIKICFETLTSVCKRFGVKKWKFKIITQAHTTRARIPPRLAGKIEEFRLLPEPIRLEDSQNSARRALRKTINLCKLFLNTCFFYFSRCLLFIHEDNREGSLSCQDVGKNKTP